MFEGDEFVVGIKVGCVGELVVWFGWIELVGVVIEWIGFVWWFKLCLYSGLVCVY